MKTNIVNKTLRTWYILPLYMVMMLGFSSCNLDTFPSDELNSELLLQDAKGAEYIMDGCYAVLKDEVDFLGYASGNCYVRHYFQMSEFPADNICLSAHTTDPLYEATAYMMTDGLKNVGTLWMVAYKAIYMTNTVIATLDPSKPENNQLLGEAYFMRGLMHLHMVTLYALPYSFGRDNLGVPLRTSTSSEGIKRNSVGEVYDQIVADLRKAADLMGQPRVAGNAGYPCKEAALGILSRVYLYMGEYDKCIETVNEALNGAAPDSKLEPTATFPTYFTRAKDSKETLFCIVHETSDDRGQSSIGSMYLKDGIGWGEIYPSDPLMYLYERHPEDIRYIGTIDWTTKENEKTGKLDTVGCHTTGLIWPQFSGKPGMKVYVTVPASDSDPAAPHIKYVTNLIDNGGQYSFKGSDGNTYAIEKRMVNGEAKPDPAGPYFEYHANYMGEDCMVRINKDVTLRTGYTIPMVFVKKFSYQDGNPMLSSPVLCRWAEVILNRAEAYARSGKDAKALDDVNVIRTRAGIPTYTAGNLQGYENVIDIVMDERRMELAWEGHRHFDMCRNKLPMDRRYAGAQPYKIVDPNTELHIIYPIPNNEWTVSGIQQNPGY